MARFDRAAQDVFLTLISQGEDVSAAARAVGVSRSAIYKRIDRTPSFKASFETAREMFMDAVEGKVHKIAMDDGHRFQWQALSRMYDRRYPNRAPEVELTAERLAELCAEAGGEFKTAEQMRQDAESFSELLSNAAFRDAADTIAASLWDKAHTDD